jgi:hypothetical protein
MLGYLTYRNYLLVFLLDKLLFFYVSPMFLRDLIEGFAALNILRVLTSFFTGLFKF